MKRTMTSKLIAFGLATAAFGSLVGVAPSENKAYAASESVVYHSYTCKRKVGLHLLRTVRLLVRVVGP